MTRVDHQDRNDPYWYRKTAVQEYIADDRIWFWAMGTARIHDERIRGGEVLTSAHDIAVQNILRLGIYDWTPEDRPWDGSTRSMRYAAVMGDRLWEMLRLERQRVGSYFS
jgi:hypothetical protein